MTYPLDNSISAWNNDKMTNVPYFMIRPTGMQNAIKPWQGVVFKISDYESDYEKALMELDNEFPGVKV